MNSPDASGSVAKETAINTSLAVGAVAAPVATLHEVHNADPSIITGVEHIPGVEHSSSTAGSWIIGAALTVAAEGVAARLENRGHETPARRVRRVGRIISVAGAMTTHAIVEGTNFGGVSDKWDLVAGTAGTIPGIIVGSAMGDFFKRSPIPSPEPQDKVNS